MTEQNLLDRLASKDRRIDRIECDLKAIKGDNKSLANNVRNLTARNAVLRAKIATLVDLVPDAHEKIDALLCLASDCKHLD